MSAVVKGFSKLDSHGLSIAKDSPLPDSYLPRDGKLLSTFTKAPTK